MSDRAEIWTQAHPRIHALHYYAQNIFMFLIPGDVKIDRKGSSTNTKKLITQIPLNEDVSASRKPKDPALPPASVLGLTSSAILVGKGFETTHE